MCLLDLANSRVSKCRDRRRGDKMQEQKEGKGSGCKPGYSDIIELDHSVGRKKGLLGDQTAGADSWGGVVGQRTAKQCWGSLVSFKGTHRREWGEGGSSMQMGTAWGISWGF